MFTKMFYAVVLSLSVVTFAKAQEDYMSLDRKIVKAYNKDPKKMKSVYVHSMHILKQAIKDDSTTGELWALKARKLITVSCFVECTKAVDGKLYRDAYIWAKRGLKTGTNFGKIGKNPVSNFYNYLDFASKELAKTPMVKNTPKKVLDSRINDYEQILAVLFSLQAYSISLCSL